MKNIIPYSSFLPRFARALRKDMTFAEVLLWKKLRDHGMMEYDFHRQKPVLNFIADFYCKELKLVIEVDGITHLESDVIERDVIKEMELNKYGIEVIRFSDRQVITDMGNVLRAIQGYVEEFEEKNGVNERVRGRRGKRGGE